MKVDCPYPLSQVAARDGVVWALTEQRALLYREGVSSFCPEGEQWKCDIVRYHQGGAGMPSASCLPHPVFCPRVSPRGTQGSPSWAEVAP